MIVDANGVATLFAGVDGIPFYTVLVVMLRFKLCQSEIESGVFRKKK